LLSAKDRGAELRHLRDKSLLLLGFWRGFRGDELSRLAVENIEAMPGQGMVCFLGSTKETAKISALRSRRQLCRACVQSKRIWIGSVRPI
jgi:hypothetical protein